MPDFKEEARIIRELTRAGSGPDPFSSAVRATRMPMLITDPRRDDNPIVFANAAFARLTGFDRGEIIGQNCRFLQGPQTDRGEVARLRASIEALEPIELELLNYKKDGTTFWNRLLVSPVFAEDGSLTYFFASQFDVTLERERLVRLQNDRDALEAEVARRNVDLQASEQRLRLALEAGRLGTWSIDVDTERLIASDSCKEICGRKPSDPLSLSELRDTIHPDDLLLQTEAIASAIADRTPLDMEYRLKLPQGEERWVQVRGQANYRADGSPLSIIGTTQDITERRNAQAQRTLLANELNHRVKNTLASLQAVIAQTMRRASSIADAEKTISSRIQAMSAANDLLISEQFVGTSISELLRRALAPFGIEDQDRFTFSGEEIRLPSNLVSSLALAVHELATNATKYGALSNDRGAVSVDWALLPSIAVPQMRLTWTEFGGPPVIPPSRTGFGTQLINRVLVAATGAVVDLTYEPRGFRFSAVIPLADQSQHVRSRSTSDHPQALPAA